MGYDSLREWTASLYSSPNIKINRQQNNFDEKDLQFAFVPAAEELSELLDDLGLMKNISTNDYIVAPDVLSNRKYLEDSDIT